MKKFISLTLSLGLLLCAGCQANTQKPSPQPTATADSEDILEIDDSSPGEDIPDDEGVSNADEISNDDETAYVSYTEYENEIDDIMVEKINNAGNHGSEAELRENENIFLHVWRNEYNSIVDHLIVKCEYDEDREHLVNMKESIDSYVKEYRKAAETEILDAYGIPHGDADASGVTRNSLRGNGTRSRLNLLAGEVYRDAAIKLIKNMNDQDGYAIRFDEDKYDRAGKILSEEELKNIDIYDVTEKVTDEEKEYLDYMDADTDIFSYEPGIYRYPFTFFDINQDGQNELITLGFGLREGICVNTRLSDGKIVCDSVRWIANFTIYPDSHCYFYEKGHTNLMSETYTKVTKKGIEEIAYREWEIDGETEEFVIKYNKIGNRKCSNKAYDEFVSKIKKGKRVKEKNLTWYQ